MPLIVFMNVHYASCAEGFLLWLGKITCKIDESTMCFVIPSITVFICTCLVVLQVLCMEHTRHSGLRYDVLVFHVLGISVLNLEGSWIAFY
jgi:hypothetical protein